MTMTIRGLVLTVGGTPEPLIFSVRSLRPERVAVVHSGDTGATARKVQEALAAELPSTVWRAYVIDQPEELADCFKRVQEAVADMRTAGLAPRQVAIDFTGGTKAMSAAATLAVGLEGCRFIYVGGWARTRNGVGTVVSGREKIIEPGNPWELLEEPALRRVISFADLCLWPAALAEVDAILGRCKPKDGDMFRLLRDVLEGLARWDAFDHAAAWTTLGLGGKWTEKGGKKSISGSPGKPGRLYTLACATEHVLLQRFADAVGKSVGTLAGICLSLNEQPDRGPDPLVIDLLDNADRRARQGMFDEAYLRLYRALELAADRTMRRLLGFGADSVPAAEVPAEMAESPGVYRDPASHTVRLGLRAAYRLLALKDVAIGKAYERLSEHLDVATRNECWLIHGQRHVTREQVESFRAAVADFLGMSRRPAKALWPRLAEVPQVPVTRNETTVAHQSEAAR